MTLRMPGCAPFHLHVTFKANPGEEMLNRADKASVITGDGVYDEIWLEPHKWHREVTLGDYHAVEVEGDGGRKMQAGTDYEPSRVLMLLDSLLTPVPKSLFSKENGRSGHWKADTVKAGDTTLMRLSSSFGNQHADFFDSYYFHLTTGLLLMSNSKGLITLRSGFQVFDNKAVPKDLVIKAGERTLLEAQITIAPAGEVNPDWFVLEGPAAEPGMTLRPLQPSDVRMPDLGEGFSWISQELGPGPAFSMFVVLDRSGHYREAEILLAPSPREAAIILSHFRRQHIKPATIDHSPCQVQVLVSVL
jgi:hypothetical protein